jgi:hypothetical protein
MIKANNDQDVVIRSTSGALTYLYNLSLDRANLRFRGQANIKWPLQPSIYRPNKGFERYQTVLFEKYILSEKPPSPQPPLTHTTFDLEWLMLCQHYGIPTRLLDWTTDILTALFFACDSKENRDKDGAIFICDQNNYTMFSAYNDHARNTQDLAFINTNIVNPRMRTQSGCFMIWGNAPLDDTNKGSYDLEQYDAKHNNTNSVKKIHIPQESKKKILDELEKTYSIAHNSLYLKNSRLEHMFLAKYNKLEYYARLMTLYETNPSQLSSEEIKAVRLTSKVNRENMFGGCVSLTR